MPIDLAQVDWLYVIVLAIFVYLSCLIGGLLAYNNRMTAAALAALIFAAMFIGWTYYPHGLPLPTRLTDYTVAPSVPAPVAPVIPSEPVRPRNPVTDITPPRNPVTDVTPPAAR